MSHTAFRVLAELASKTQKNALALPDESENTPRQSAIGFSLLGYKFLAPMGQIAEMLEMPSFTRLPGVQPWVIGLSNVRGRLLPLFDLTMFFGGKPISQRRKQRVLVLDSEQLYCGLVVDQSFGMQHFMGDVFKQSDLTLPEALQPFVKGEYIDTADVSWSLFDVSAIANHSLFLNAAST